MIKEYQGRVTLGAGHSLIVGHGPQMKNLQALEEAAKLRKIECSSFGMFQLGTNDSIEQYKDATEDDVNLKESQFIRPVFRLLSEVIVRKQFDPIDFSKNGILKASMPLMLGQTVYKNHMDYVDNEVGAVSKVFWDRGYETEDGLVIPAGFNGEFLIDSKMHEATARGILMDPPSIHSNSVTLNFGWEQSHPKMDFNTFREKVGTYDNKGELIRRIASKVFAYFSTSLVPHGADPFAQKTGKDGKIVNPVMAANRDSFCEHKQGAGNIFLFSYKDELSDITIPATLNNNDAGIPNNPNTKKMNKELILLLAGISGFAISDEQRNLDEEAFQEAFDLDKFTAEVVGKKTEIEALTQLEETVATLTQEKTDLETELADLRTFKTTNEAASAELGVVKADLQAEVKRLFASTTGADPSAKLAETFENADINTLKAFKESYETQLEDKFPMECAECGSHNVSRASTEFADDEDGKSKEKKNAPKKAKTDEELYRELRMTSIK